MPKHVQRNKCRKEAGHMPKLSDEYIKARIAEKAREFPWLSDKGYSDRAQIFDYAFRSGDFDFPDLEAGSQHPRFSGTRARPIILLALSGYRNAHLALCLVAEDLTSRGRRLPKALQAYIVRTARWPPRWKRGRRGATLIHRDEAIYRLVEFAVKEFNLKARRNRASLHLKTACFYVSEALGKAIDNLSEDGVKTVWEKRRSAHKKAVASLRTLLKC